MNVVSVTASGAGKGGGGAIDLLLLAFGGLTLALRRLRRRWLLAAVASALPLAGLAGEPGWYAGGQWGSARGDSSRRDINSTLAGLGYDVDVDFDDASRSAWKVFGGYRMSAYLGAQIGYTQLGDVRSRINGNIIDVDQLLTDVTRIHPHSADGVEVTLTGRYPLAAKFAVTGQVGLLHWQSIYRAVNSLGDEFARFEDSGTDTTLGVGIEYSLAPQWTLCATWNRYDVGGETVSLAAVGANYRFTVN